MKAIHVFGCSHSKFFFNGAQVARRLDLEGLGIQIEGRFVRAASVAGFRPRRSTLETKEIINSALPQAKALCLAFGQVDLELGYYYRVVVKEEELTPSAYVAWLCGIYEEFVDGLPIAPDQLAFKGMNLTVLTEPKFTYRYVKRTIKQQGNIDKVEKLEKLEAAILSEDAQNGMSLAMNEGLRGPGRQAGQSVFRFGRENPRPQLLDAQVGR